IGLVQEDLYASRRVLQGGETCLAHDTFEHHAASHLHLLADVGQGLLVEFVIRLMQIGGATVRAEIVGVGDTFGTQLGEFATAFGYQVVFVDGNGGRGSVVHLIQLVEPVRISASRVAPKSSRSRKWRILSATVPGGASWPCSCICTNRSSAGKSSGWLSRICCCIG